MSTGQTTPFQPVPAVMQPDPTELMRTLNEVIRAVNQLGAGKSGNSLEVTLTANSATTTVASPLIGYLSQFLWDPLTANAQTEIAVGIPLALVTARLIGSVTFTHVNNAEADRIFRVAVVG